MATRTPDPSSAGSPIIDELGRFGLVGVASNIAYFGALWLLRRALAMRWGLSAGIAFGLSMGVNYALQRSYTFRSRSSHWTAGRRYVVTQLVGLGINSAMLELSLEHRVVDAMLGPVFSAAVVRAPVVPEIPVRFLVAQSAALAMTIVWSYLAQKFWVFREHRERHG